MTIHPDASGRPHALLMHERLIEHINKHEGVEWVTMEQVCLVVSNILKQVLRTNELPLDVRPFQEQKHSAAGGGDAG